MKTNDSEILKTCSRMLRHVTIFAKKTKKLGYIEWCTKTA